MPDISKIITGSPESLPEKSIEKGFETQETPKSFNPEKIKEIPVEPSRHTSPVVPFVLTEPVVLQKKVEKILEEGLEQLYFELNPEEQAKFRNLGENTAQKITGLLQQAKVKIEEILSLIRQWLMSVGDVNRYYAEQEAKIKASKILKLRQEK